MGSCIQKMYQDGLLGLVIGLLVKSCFGHKLLELSDIRDVENASHQPEFGSGLGLAQFNALKLKENKVLSLESNPHIRMGHQYNSACEDKLSLKKCNKLKKQGKCDKATGKKKCQKTC